MGVIKCNTLHYIFCSMPRLMNVRVLLFQLMLIVVRRRQQIISTSIFIFKLNLTRKKRNALYWTLAQIWLLTVLQLMEWYLGFFFWSRTLDVHKLVTLTSHAEFAFSLHLFNHVKNIAPRKYLDFSCSVESSRCYGNFR